MDLSIQIKKTEKIDIKTVKKISWAQLKYISECRNVIF